MITNREIRNERLLEEAVAEVTESALGNDDEKRVAAALRNGPRWSRAASGRGPRAGEPVRRQGASEASE